MFARMLKYEWKRSAPLFGGLTLGALGLGIVGIVVLRIMVSAGNSMDQVQSETGMVGTMVLMSSMSALLMLLYLALLAYASAINLVGLYRFYKTRFTDEGYLTFTLPVSVHDIFLSALVNLLIWGLISVVTVLVSIFLVIVFGPVESGLVNTDVFKIFGELFDALQMLYEETGFSLAGILLCIPVIAVSSIVVSMSCITIGAVIAKKLKLLVAIGLNYVVGVVVSVVMSIAQVVIMVEQIEQETISLDPLFWLISILYGVLAVGGYFLSTHLMRRKLNLP